MTENVLKCTLKPINFAAYPVACAAAEESQLRTAFPSGVCDYSKPGLG